MTLEIGLKFIYHEGRKCLFLADYKSDISCDNYFSLFALNDFDKTSYVQKVLNEELEAALKRTNERLLAAGYGEGNACISITKTGAGGSAKAANDDAYIKKSLKDD